MSQKYFYLSLFVFLGLFSEAVNAETLDLIYKNNRGVRSFKKEKHLEAYEEFLSLLANDPYHPQLQFNVGSSLFGVGEEEKSSQLYLQLLKDIEQQLLVTSLKEDQQKLLKIKYAILYNLGVFYQKLQDAENALKYYQKALELLPDSKEIKTNIEMMFSGGGGGGKGKNKDKKDDKGEGKGGEGDQDQPQDEKDPKDPSQGQQKDPQKQQGQKNKGFDQSQMSMENLERIMEELKQQEQNIRSKVQRKGSKSEPKEKQW